MRGRSRPKVYKLINYKTLWGGILILALGAGGFSFLSPILPPSTLSGPSNFYEAKPLLREIYRDYPLTFYCSCSFNQEGKIDLASCGYRVQTNLQRAQRLEWEHIVPVSQMAMHLACWKNKLCSKGDGKRYQGRACCREQDPSFSKMEADLHNIVPEIGELNGCRSNFRFGLLPQIKSGQFGACAFKIDPETRRVEPRAEVRGQIARAYLYVAKIYHLHLSDSQRKLFWAWNKQYPPESWEIERDRRIANIQGNHNPYISEYDERIVNE